MVDTGSEKAFDFILYCDKKKCKHKLSSLVQNLNLCCCEICRGGVELRMWRAIKDWRMKHQDVSLPSKPLSMFNSADGEKNPASTKL